MTRLTLRPPEQVLNLARMGCYHQTRLSFMRSLLRLAWRQKWQFHRSSWDIDSHAVGHAVYQIHIPYGIYSLVAFAHQLDPKLRSDRVIAEAWDATFVLMQGQPNQNDITRLKANVPLQEGGRVSHKELCLSRANRSSRLWQYCVDALAQGQQPRPAKILNTGYLMRTTAVYGNAKFGAAQRPLNASLPANENCPLSHDNPLAAPFRIEMLCVWLIRCFSIDLLEFAAQCRGGHKAVALDSKLKHCLGIGNSTGLGMAPFLMNHPLLLHRWSHARETALAHARAQPSLNDENIDRFHNTLQQATKHAHSLHCENAIQTGKNQALAQDLDRLSAYLARYSWPQANPSEALYRWGEAHMSLEGQEMLVSLLIETIADKADILGESMAADEEQGFFVDASQKLAVLKRCLAENFAWTDDIDFSNPSARARFWYVSANKLEPRLGERYQEKGSECEMPLAIAYDVASLKSLVQNYPCARPLADFLQEFPQTRHIVRRALLSARYPYAEIRDNIISAQMFPADLLRFKLSFFGATRFDLRSDRWLRINMYQNAPFPDEITTASEAEFDDWVYAGG